MTSLEDVIARAMHMEWPLDDYEAVPLDEIFPTPRPRYIFLWNIYTGRARAALAAIEASGPTDEMLRAGREIAHRLDCPITFVTLRSVFRAMLSAAPPRDTVPTDPEPTDVCSNYAALRKHDALALDAFRREAVEQERERCVKIARGGARLVRDGDIKFVSPAKYAADLAEDIADAIESGEEPQ